MQRKYLYVYKKLLEDAINKAKSGGGTKLHSEFVYACLMNKKLVELHITVYDNQFNPSDIEGYDIYLKSEQKLYDGFIEQHKEEIKDTTKIAELENELKIILLNNRKDNYKDLFKKLDELNKQKLEFLEQEFEYTDKFKKFKLAHFPQELDEFFQSFMEIFIDLICE